MVDRNLLKYAVALWENKLISNGDLERIRVELEHTNQPQNKVLVGKVTTTIDKGVDNKKKKKKGGRLDNMKRNSQEMIGNFVHNFERISK